MPKLLSRLLNAVPVPWQRPPARDFRVLILDPDGMPSGEIYLLSIEQVARLVSFLRRETEPSLN
jgi:hypothetical protein